MQRSAGIHPRVMLAPSPAAQVVAHASETLKVVQTCVESELLKTMLPHLLEQLEICQKSLSQYLGEPAEIISPPPGGACSEAARPTRLRGRANRRFPLSQQAQRPSAPTSRGSTSSATPRCWRSCRWGRSPPRWWRTSSRGSSTPSAT